MTSQKDNSVDLNGYLWHHLTNERISEILQVNLSEGLPGKEIDHRLVKYGFNKLTPQKRMNEIVRFLRQFHQPLLYILLAASVITFLLGEKVDSLVIFSVVFINAFVGYLQEAKAEKAIDALAKMVITEADVLREGVKRRISSQQLVPGDIVFLQSGDKVPADVRLFQVRNLRIDESSLTGESVSVEKGTEVVAKDAVLSDRSNMAYAGTMVTYGQAKAVVCLTGDRTEIGRIADMTLNVADLSTPLTKKIAQFSRLLLAAILFLAVIVFFIGVLRGNSFLDMFMASVALAVGAIPEGLPAAVTITLAIGVSRMAKRRAIIRKLPAVEALGSTTVICSDKTGTLTENKMTVKRIYAGNSVYEVTGDGYGLEGEIFSSDQKPTGPNDMALQQCLLAGLLCNDAQVHNDPDRIWVQGDPMEGAFIFSAGKAGLFDKEHAKKFPRIDGIPFESEFQYMATLHKGLGEQNNRIYVKGAVEKVLERCDRQLSGDGRQVELERMKVLSVVELMARQGLRILAFARKEPDLNRDIITHEDVAGGLTFLGLQMVVDPPRPEAVEAVRRCQSAGIQVKMITGDHVSTAEAIARQIGIKAGKGFEDKAYAITGKELQNLSEEELLLTVERTAVFARVVPEQKLRLVKSLQSRGHVVAMTGDGVNDAPALKQANIGVAMGITGTEVAKSAADMLLTDDNFSSIEAAVEEGRCIFDNLTKFIVWTLPTNAGEAIIILFAIFAGTTLPVLPVQLLWINMVTAIFLGLMLVFEPKEEGLMARPPRSPDEPILTFELLMRTGLVALLMAAGSFWIFMHDQRSTGSQLMQSRTLVVNLIVMVEMVYLFNCRSLIRSVFTLNPFTNPWVWAGSGVMLGLQLAFTYVPVMNRLFHSSPIEPMHWLVIIGISAVIFMTIETEKWLRGIIKSRQN